MRRITALLLYLSAALPLAVSSYGTEPSFSPLDSLLAQYYSALERDDTETKNREMDFLIGSCRDSLTKGHVALAVFDHYRDSPLMGEESVAIHVYDRWFADGSVKFTGPMEAMEAEVFVKFNRNSQIGMDAPVLTMRRPCGGRKTFPLKGRTSILFFYDTSCAKCRLESALFPEVLKEVDFDMDFYAVYSGSDRRSWNLFRRSFSTGNPHVKVFHLWDPDMDSDYQMQYGVTGTPRVFMVEPQGTVFGRRLEMDALKELLPYAGAVQKAYDSASAQSKM